MLTAIFMLGTIGLLFGILLTALTILKEQRWLRSVIVPWFASISKAVNPEKK
jgi:hypothetical protein